MAFVATIIYCGLLSGQCIQFNDAQGPYATKTQCETRLKIMLPETQLVIGTAMPLEFFYYVERCEKGVLANNEAMPSRLRFACLPGCKSNKMLDVRYE